MGIANHEILEMGSKLAEISNPLATLDQIKQSASALDGVPSLLIHSIRYQNSLLTQHAGVLLRLPQDVIAQAIVTLTRFYLGSDGGSFRSHAAKDFSAASLYLTAKLSASPVSPRSILNIYAFLLSEASPFSTSDLSQPQDPTSFTLSEGEHQRSLLTLQRSESLILRTLSYQTNTVLPHGLALTYLSTLGALPPGSPTTKSRALAARTLELLNTALLSPQLLYVTHQPHALAVSAIYLAARQTAVRLVGEGAGPWWEVFDVDREELGFLVVGMLSLKDWAEQERREGRFLGPGGRWLLSVGDVEREMEVFDQGVGDGIAASQP